MGVSSKEMELDCREVLASRLRVLNTIIYIKTGCANNQLEFGGEMMRNVLVRHHHKVLVIQELSQVCAHEPLL